MPEAETALIEEDRPEVAGPSRKRQKKARADVFSEAQIEDIGSFPLVRSSWLLLEL